MENMDILIILTIRNAPKRNKRLFSLVLGAIGVERLSIRRR